MEKVDELINVSQIISVINKMLMFVDERLVHHGERVAYIVSEMISHCKYKLNIDEEKLMILSYLHDVGAYKTEEIDEMISFDGGAVWSHSVYGYLFLKYMSPMGDEAEAILYHHLDYIKYNETESKFLDYAAIIYLADRVDILSQSSGSAVDFNMIKKYSGIRFNPKFVDLFFDSQPEKIIESLQDGSYHEKLYQKMDTLSFSIEQAFEYLKMMVFSVDFRSEYTVTHTINTTAISLELGKRLGLAHLDLQKIYLGALLHDVGKAAIDPAILEFQGRLSPSQMDIMKQHVVYSRKIIEGVVNDEIVEIAVRHHEKLDGSGYPDGLKESELTLPQQIVAVADIVSALTGKRSYKEAFSKEKTLDILRDMQIKGQLGFDVCEKMITDFDDIISATDESRNPIINLYARLHNEYFKLNEKIQNLVK